LPGKPIVAQTHRKENRLAKEDSPLWQKYEEQVAELVAALDSNAEVIHNKRVEAQLSKAIRQVDVWVRGKIIGQEIIIVVECKMASRPLAIDTVDAFVGKLLDLGADRGVLYSASGMTPNAVWRAQMAMNPSVIPVTLEPAPPRAPGYPAGFDEADYAGWLNSERYREHLMAMQWTPWYASGMAEEDPRWENVPRPWEE
jgi:Restriction endonuclease